MTPEEMFETAGETDFLKFDQIPEADRRHRRPDICAFLYLSEKLGGDHDIICAAEHDVIHLDYAAEDCAALSRDDVTYLSRCGVMLGDYGLEMFV